MLEETLRLRVPADVKTVLEAEALRLDRSVGWVVRQVLQDWVEVQKALIALGELK